METYNIYKHKKNDLLGSFYDHRGSINDIFYQSNIEHVTLISSEKNSIRGNHYHKKTTQHILVISGSLEYWYKKINDDEAPKVFYAKTGDVVTSKPLEIHAMRTTEEACLFMVFTEGLRGGNDYENDTFRVESINCQLPHP